MHTLIILFSPRPLPSQTIDYYQNGADLPAFNQGLQRVCSEFVHRFLQSPPLHQLLSSPRKNFPVSTFLLLFENVLSVCFLFALTKFQLAKMDSLVEIRFDEATKETLVVGSGELHVRNPLVLFLTCVSEVVADPTKSCRWRCCWAI
jgi:hypothetical protein